MGDKRPSGRSWAEEWKRALSGVVSLSATAAASLGLPAAAALTGDSFAALVDAARGWLIGRKRTFSLSGQDLTLVLEDLSVEGSDLARAIGQYGRVHLRARDVEWSGFRFEWIEVHARNLHLRPGAKPVLVTAPILFEAFVSASAASAYLATVSPRLELAVHAGVPQVGLVGAPWIRLEVAAGAGGQSVRIQPRAVYLLDWRVSVPSPAFDVPLPPMPLDDLMLTSVESAPGGFLIKGVLTEWQRTLTRDDLDRLLATIRGGRDRPDA
ncbi:MAG TPA: hypothetical protein VME19_19950 [Streptosporangiaceae bacterium]|nr:hypothetical protein [Streptosporangiaceae bacterium]